MHSQTVRLFIYSSLAIVALTLVWGLRQIPRQGALAEEHLRTSLEQELSLLATAAKSTNAALKFRLLDVLKAEGNDHPTRAFQDSPFQAATLLEWDGVQWKVLWHSSKDKDQFQAPALKTWIDTWPLAKLDGDEAFFTKVDDVNGVPYFAMVVKVARPSNTPMLGIGVFPASQYGLSFAADQQREVRVFDDKGFALALTHPAYVGATLKREPLVAEILDGESLSLRQEWKSERGIPMLGLAQRLNESNLFVSVETNTALSRQWYLQAWIYLVLSAAGAVAINWVLFSSLIKPLLEQLSQTEDAAEKLHRQLLEKPTAPAQPTAGAPLPVVSEIELPDIDFLEPGASPKAAPAPLESESIPLAKIVGSALRGIEPRLREAKISINKIGLDAVMVGSDVPQMQTALEEVFKNAIEAMDDSADRQLTVSAFSDAKRIHLTIEDTGAGIAPENVRKVFDPFFSTRDSQGVARGLGLNVVRRVVEELKGTVEVRNRGSVPGAVVEMQWPRESYLGEVAFESAPTAASATVAPTPTANVPSAKANPVSSDLDFLDDGEDAADVFSTRPPPPPPAPAVRPSLEVPIRKPKVNLEVRSVD